MGQDSPGSAHDLLTPREREVLELLRLGLTNAEIAERLGITLAGARYHVSEIIGKLSVRDRYEAAAWQPDRRGWVGQAAPLALFDRKFRLGWLSWAAGGVVVAAVAVGVGLLSWGLVRMDRDANVPSSAAEVEVRVTPPRTVLVVFPTPDATILASIPTPLPTPLDASLCEAVPQDGAPHYGGALERTSFPSLELQTDAVELIVTGTVRRRDVTVTQPWSSPHVITLGEAVVSRPLPVLICQAKYSIEVSEVLKNARGDDVGDRISMNVYEREVYLEDESTIEVVPALSPGDEVVLFLLGGGCHYTVVVPPCSDYAAFGPRLVMEQDGLRAAGDYRGYTAELGGVTASELLGQVRSRASVASDVLPFLEVLDRLRQ